MLTNNDYCDLELTTILQEVGMPIKNVVATSPQGAAKWYSNVTLYEAQKWLREEKKIDVFVRAGYLGKNRVRHYFVEVFTSKDVITLDNDREDFSSFEEALSEGIKEAVKILKEDDTLGIQSN